MESKSALEPAVEVRNSHHSKNASRWFWGLSVVAICLVIILVAMPFVQNYRTIQQLKSLNADITNTEPGILLGTLPSSWQTWLRNKFGKDCLLPFETITGVDFDRDTSVCDDDLSCLKGLTKLNSLRLLGTQVSDAGLVHLKGLTRLKSLELGSYQVGDAGLVHLTGLTKLARLHLLAPKVSDAGLTHLKMLAKLNSLELSLTKVSGAGLVHLKGLTKLSGLILSQTEVNDAGLVYLKGFANLKLLILWNTNVSDAGVMELRKTLPDCEIYY